MKDRCMQLSAIAEEICNQDKKAAAVLMVSSGGKQFAYVHGKAIDLAADLACMMHQTPGFDEVVKMAVDAYDNVPLK